MTAVSIASWKVSLLLAWSHIVWLIGTSLLIVFLLLLRCHVLKLLTTPHLLLLSSLVGSLLTALLMLHIHVIALLWISLIVHLVMRILALHAHHFKLVVDVVNFIFVVWLLYGVFLHDIRLLVTVIFFFFSLIVQPGPSLIAPYILELVMSPLVGNVFYVWFIFLRVWGVVLSVGLLDKHILIRWLIVFRFIINLLWVFFLFLWIDIIRAILLVIFVFVLCQVDCILGLSTSWSILNNIRLLLRSLLILMVPMTIAWMSMLALPLVGRLLWWLSLMVRPWVLHLLTLVKLVANALIIHLTKLHNLETIVVPVDLDRIANYVFKSIIMTHDFDLVDDTVLARTWLSKYFVVVTCNQQVRDGVASSYFNLAVVATQHKAICWFHQSHWNRMIWNINGVVWCRYFVLALVHTSVISSSSLILMLTTTLVLPMLLGALLELLHSWHRLLTKRISKLRLEVYKLEKWPN